jgi:hypothetical protein
MKMKKENSNMEPRNLILIPILVIGLCVLPKARAVSPAPDGGYPGGNTAEGQGALFSLTTGTYNTALGFLSLRTNTEGNLNTAIGAGTLLLNTSEANTATGAGALLSNTLGSSNTGNGTFALFSNTIGGINTANGFNALFANVNGFQNTANGASALSSNTSGNFNTATGVNALGSNIDGDNNTAHGLGALHSNTAGSSNTAIGINALGSNISGAGNVALGINAGNNVGSADNVICIGHGGADVSNTCYIGNIRGVTTGQMNAVPVLIDAVGQLGTANSSGRFKKEIKPMENASDVILALKPVTFRYKSDTTGTPQFGLIAEEVAAVNPDLVVRDDKGEIYTVRYDAVNAMLLNEFLKEHRKVEQQDRKMQLQEATIAELKSGMKTLAATLNEQAAQLQKVSARIEVSKSAPRTVVNNR